MSQKITLYDFTRIHLPYQLHMDASTRQFFWVNREYAPLGKTKQSGNGFWNWPDLTGGSTSEYLYDDDTAPRTKSSTERLLRARAQLQRTVLDGFTERVDFSAGGR